MEAISLLSLLMMIQLPHICPPVAAAATSRPIYSTLERRLDSVCGGDSSLQQCGAPFPSDFCCPQSAACLQLESSAMAVLCCPAGQDCKFVSPISCDRTAQNATLLPGNQLHSDPTTQLDQCGDSCCPPGAACHSGLCAVQAVATSSSTTTRTSSVSVSSTSSLSASTTGDHVSQSTSPAMASTSPNTLDDIDITDTAKRLGDEFSGKSFVAGLFPGIVIGVVAVALLMWYLNRRRRQHRNRNYPADYNEKKHFSAADQLTSLTPDPYRRPTHMRSISEPVSDPANGHRTDFVRGTPSPPRAVDALNINNTGSYTATATGPIGPTTPAPTPKIRALFSRSTIFQSPPTPPTNNNFPSHMKRGTLTHAYTISPIRALRSKKSSHSLRREMTADAAAAPQPLNTRGARHRHPPHPPLPQNRTRPDLPTTNSTETIKISMPRIELNECSPDQRSKQQYGQNQNQNQNQHRRLPSEPPIIPPHNSQPTSSWTTLSSSPHYPAPIRSQPSSSAYDYDKTPTRVPASQARFADRALGTPFLSVSNSDEREEDNRRQTTFSGFMERAGIRSGGA